MNTKTNKTPNNLQDLIEAMNNEKLIIFVGAGISQNSGMPSWNELIDPLRKELGFDDSEKDYLKIAQYYFVNYPDKYKSKINEIFGDLDTFQPNSLHELIQILEPEHVITTNYDNLLETQLNSQEKKYSVIATDNDIPQANSKHQILKMHGDFSHNNIVLNEDDYIRYAYNFPAISSLIESHLMNHTVLFIGYGLNDSTFKALLDRILINFGSNARTHYYFNALTPKPVDIKYYASKGIQLISGNIEISDTDTSAQKNEKMRNATSEFLTRLIENKSNAEQTSELNTNLKLIKSINAKTSDDIWKNINFLNNLNYVESQDIFRYANISEKALLYPNNQIIFRSDYNKDELNISENKKLVHFLEEKTWISNFLGTELSHTAGIEINPTLEPIFELYKQKQYSKAFAEFDKISSSALKSKDYWNYFIAEFNLNHIVLPYGEKETRTKKSELEQVINDVISNGELNDKRLASYFKDEIQSFRFIYKKLYKINDILDNFKKEHITYKNGGYSSNNNLWTAYYEVNSLMAFINGNCITVYQYKEFQNIITRYFECLIISLDNSNYQNSQHDLFQSTSSIVKELSKDDIKLIIPHINFKNISVIMDTYNLRQVLISEEAGEFLYEKIKELKRDLLASHSFEKTNELEAYINFLSLTNNIKIDHITDILDNYSITQINSTIISKLLVMLLNNTNSLNKKNASNLYPVINQHLCSIVSKNYFDTHSRNFYMYGMLLEKNNELLDSNINIFETSENQMLDVFSRMVNNTESILKLPQYSTYIINFYQFFTIELKNKLEEVLQNYEKLDKKEFNIYFGKEILSAGIYNFPLRKEDLLLSWKKIITTPENPGMKTFPDPKTNAIHQIVYALDNEYITKDEIEKIMDLNLMKGYDPEIDWKFFKVHTEEMVEKILQNTNFAKARKMYSDTPYEEKLWDEWLLEQGKLGHLKPVNKLFK